MAVLKQMLCDSKKLWVFVGFCGFSGSQKRVAFALPKKRWNAGLRVFNKHGMPL